MRLFFYLLMCTTACSVAQQTSEQPKEISLNEVALTSKKWSKKDQRRIQKLQNPKWLEVLGTKGFFTDNKSAYVATNSFESRQYNSGRLVSQSREKFVYNNVGINRNYEYDYARLEKRIIQLALFRPEIKDLEIKIESNCEGYQDIQYLILLERDLVLLRQVNSVQRFLNNVVVSDPTVIRKIQVITKELCAS
ncbi:MAG: hypothetical protein O2914_05770 [Bacteroidetes bacterium]|nr:hypothetical protein [Bacteroidota bacterium]MDA0938327.1 hypothetical protein [Bacteroidota bacterium]MDA1344558.1 hypothetical protein [Bacteroidota bacterium]